MTFELFFCTIGGSDSLGKDVFWNKKAGDGFLRSN